MKILDRLPVQCEWWTTPNQMIAYCGYTHGKMSVNGASTIVPYVSLVIENWFGHGYTYSKYWPLLLARIISTRSLPHHENEPQQRVNHFWSCVLGNHTANRLQIVIKELLATFIGKTDCYTHSTAWWKWSSTECQWLLVVCYEKSEGRQIANSHTRSICCLDRHKRTWNAPCPILKMRVNRMSTIVSLPPWLITAWCGHSGQYTLFWLFLYTKQLKNT